MSIRVAAALAAALAIAGCDLFMPPAAGGDLDGEWRLVSGTHQGDSVPIPEDAPITMTIDGAEVGGRAACNIYGGELDVDGDRVAIGAMSMTEMGCDAPVMEAEAAYIAALGDVERWARSGSTLTFSGEAVELTYELVPEEPDAALVGTAWRLDSLITGDAVSSTVGDQPATLVLRDDGTLSGSTGCRSFDGRYEVDGESVRIGQLVTDDRACPDIPRQDDIVLTVLGEGFTYAIDEDRLTVASGQLSLVYVAEEG